MGICLSLFVLFWMLPCVWRTKHIRFNLKITPIGLFTIQIEAGCVNRRLRLKMDCKKSSFSAAHARTCTHNHTLSSLHGSCFAASASIPINPQHQLRPSDQIPTADDCFHPTAACSLTPPPYLHTYLPAVLRRCGSCGPLRLLVCRLREPIGCFVAANWQTDGVPHFPLYSASATKCSIMSDVFYCRLERHILCADVYLHTSSRIRFCAFVCLLLTHAHPTPRTRGRAPHEALERVSVLKY